MVETSISTLIGAVIGFNFEPSMWFQRTGVSNSRQPCFLAMKSISGSKPKPSIRCNLKTDCAASRRKALNPHCVSLNLNPVNANWIRLPVSPEGLTKKRLMCSDQTAIERARPEDDVVAALGYRPDDFDDLARRGRQVGVEKESDLALGLEHSVSHGIAFPPIPRILDQPQPVARSTLEFANLIGSMVC